MIALAAYVSGSAAAAAEGAMIPEGHRGNCAMCHGKQPANTYVFDVARSIVIVRFIGSGPPLAALAERIRGGFVFDVAQPDHSSVTAEFDADAIKSPDGLVTNFLRSSEFLDSQRFPTIRFVSSSIKKQDDQRYRIAGDLTVHGSTAPLQLDATFEGAGSDPVYATKYASFHAAGDLSCKDFGIVLCTAADKIRMEIFVVGSQR